MSDSKRRIIPEKTQEEKRKKLKVQWELQKQEDTKWEALKRLYLKR